MSIKKIVIAQYQQIVDRAGSSVEGFTMPIEGWMRTVRKALAMSGAQLGRRMGISRAQVSQMERGEVSGGITIKTMHKAAAALGCRFVYAIVPEGSIEEVIETRARQKATAIVEKTNKHMALEAQTISESKIKFEIDRLQQEFLKDLPSSLWNDK
jgi:predicted DNA-binding mobile mystery protein A